MSTSPIPGKVSLLSLDSVTRVRASKTEYAGPLANDLQKIMQEINELHRSIAAIQVAVPDVPVTPSALSAFDLPFSPEFRDDGAMEIAVQALTLADVPVNTQSQSTQIIFCTQATFPTLSSVAANTLIAVTDYAHLIFWDGTTPIFMDGGNCFLSLFEVDPGVGWHLYDGTAGVTYLKADGTTGTITLPDLTSAGALAAFLEAGGTNSGPTAAVAPTLAMDPYTPAGSVSAQILNGTPKTWDVVNVVSTAGTQSVLKDDATNNPYTPAGTISAGTLVGTPATLTGTISTTGEPRKLVRRPYFRK